MNILVVNYEYPPIGAGAGNASYHIARALYRLGHRVSVLTAAFERDRGRCIEDGITVYRVAALRRRVDRSSLLEMISFVIAALVKLREVVAREQIDQLIVFFSIPCGPVGLWAKARYGIPYLIALRGGDVPGTEPTLAVLHCMLTPLRRLILKQAAAVTANSRGLQELAEKADLITVAVIPNGVDAEWFSPAPVKGRALDQDRCLRILFVGRFQMQKNLIFLLRAYSALTKATTARTELHLVGDGPLKNKLVAHARFLGIEDHIVWHGWLSKERLLEQYRTADCLVNPSRYEGMPNTVLEAMACGLPVIASDVAGNRDAIQHGETGYLFALNEPSTMVSFLQSLAGDPLKVLALGSSARGHVLRKYTWIAAAESLCALCSQPG